MSTDKGLMTIGQASFRPEIIFFENDQKKSHGTLKRFLTFLKVKRVPGPIRFAFIDELGPLIPNLSLRENISLDSIPSTVSSDKEFSLEDYLERRGNEPLTKLYNNIKLVEDFPSEVDSQTLKIASLIKGLLQDGQYLFLENPERFLDKENLKLFTEALLLQLKQKKQTLLLKSSSPAIWAPHVTQWIKESTCPETGRIHMNQMNAIKKSISPAQQQNDRATVLPLKQKEEPVSTPAASSHEDQQAENSSEPKAA